MSNALTYVPPAVPRRPFAKGDVVRIVDREGEPRGTVTISRVLKTRVVTSDGRRWNFYGWLIDSDGVVYPFPSIQHADTK